MWDEDTLGPSDQKGSDDAPATGDERSGVTEPETAGADSGTSDMDPTRTAEHDEPDGRDLVDADDDEYDEEAEDDPYTMRHRATAEDEMRLVQGYGVDRNRFGASTAFGSGAIAADTVNFFAAWEQSSSKVQRGKFSSEGISALKATYVPAPSDPRLAAALVRQSVVYLGGKTGTGRETSALAALTERYGEQMAAMNLGDVSAWADAANVIGEALEEQHGYLLWLPSRMTVSPAVLAHLQRTATDRRATIVLLGDVSPAERAALHQYAVHHESPQLAEVFQQHLRHTLSGICVADCVDCDGGCLDRYVADCLTEPGVGDELRRLSSPREAVEAAHVVVDERPPPSEVDSLLRRLALARIRRQAPVVLYSPDARDHPYGERFVQHARAFRICYTLFHRLPLRDVFDATTGLLSLLDAARGSQHDEHPTYDMSVEALLGPVFGSQEPQIASDGTGNAAHLSDERLMPSILDVLWNDYGGFREPLCTWLAELARKDQWPIRQRAATIAGVLAGYDFDQVDSRLITNWARSARAAERQVAAYAMEVVTQYNDGVTKQVQENVRGWAAPSSSRRQRDTAARCYATGYGRRFPDDALKDLKSIAADRMQLERSLIGDAVAGLADSQPIENVFVALVEWLDPLSSPVASHGMRAFSLLAGHDHSDGVPTLMRRFIDGAIDKFQLAMMWRHALERATTARPAWKALEQWIGALDSDAVQSEGDVVRELLADVFSNSALRTRGAIHLERVWRRNPPQGGFQWFAEVLRRDDD